MNISKLVEGCLKGKAKAQRSLYELLTPVVYSAVRRYCASEFDADDVFQESFVRVFNNLASFDPEKGKIESWAFKIALNSSLMHLRAAKKFASEDVEDHQNQLVEHTEVDENLSMGELLENLNALPEKQRIVFNLYVIDGYSHKEIAEMMNTTESTSKSQLMKARVKLMNSKNVIEHRS